MTKKDDEVEVNGVLFTFEVGQEHPASIHIGISEEECRENFEENFAKPYIKLLREAEEKADE